MSVIVGIFPYIIRAIVALIVFKSFIEWFIHRRKFVKTINKIPGFEGYPIIGSLWIALNMENEDVIDLDLSRPKLFPGGISRAWLGPFAEVRVHTPELAQEVLLSKKCLNKARVYDVMIGDWIGDGLVLNSGEKWFKHRRLLMGTFYLDILNKYCKVFQKKADVLCEVLEKHSESGEIINIMEYFYRLAFDAILETAFGLQLDIQKDSDCAYLKASEEIGEISIKRVCNLLYHNSFIFNLSPLGRRAKEVLKVLHGFSNKVIKDRRQELIDRNFNIDENESCFLNLLLRESEKKSNLTDTEIREEVDTFMFAGHDTTAIMLTWSILLIGNHPSVQQAIYDEQVTLFGHVKTPPTQNDLPQMEYLERVVKESLRLQPPAPCISRQSAEEFELGGYTIPADCMVSIDIYQIHRDPRHFKNPEKFDPDRFLPENYKNIHPYAYIPFSAGPRSCIGQRFSNYMIKTILATLFRNYKIIPIESLDKVKTCREFVARPYPGIRVRIEKR